MRGSRSLETLLRTCGALIILPVVLALYSSCAIATALAGAAARRVHFWYVAFARACLRVGGTRLAVRGAEQVDAEQACVVVSNHESAWDPMCLVAGLPRVVIRFVVKTALMRIPIFGQALTVTGNVRVDRNRTAGDVSRIREGMGRREPEVSLLFFAEGTRSRDGAFQPFKMGAFATALGSKLPILPVAHAGTYAVWPKGTLRLKSGLVAIEVGEPISTEGLCFDDRAELRDRVHAAVAALRRAARSRLRASGYEPGGRD